MEKAARAQTSSTSSPSSSSPRHAPRRRHNERDPPDAHPRTPAARRILVSGYPNYTQPQDLIEVFAKFGTVRIDKCNSWVSTLTFNSEDEVKAALAANKRLHVYGHYLSVKPYSAKQADDSRNQQPSTPKREFPMSKKKGVIIEPKKIDLSGDFHSQLDNILSAVRLTQEDVKSLSQLYTDLEISLQGQWPGCKAVPFGSITTGLGIKTSDADCFMNIPGQYRQPNGNYVNKAKRVLLQYPSTFAEILAIPRANTPIVKFFHIPTGTNCDVTFKTPLGAQNSRLIAFLLHADPRLLPMAVLVKYWAKVHELSGTGKLTNYALTLMIIFYLQQPPLCVLPSVEWLQRDPAAAYIVDHWNTGFLSDPARLPPSTNTSSISELLGGFFEYYSMFNFDEMVICTYLGLPVKREVFKDTASMPDEFERYKKNVLNHYVMPIRHQTAMCVQDPFEQCHNVASTVTSKLAIDLKTYFKFCANAYEKDKLNGCQEFLKTILLQRPKLNRGKTHPEYRVNLFPRIVNSIISYDWKSVVREMVLELFENMLKIKLGKVEEKVNPDTRKEKEKYSGAVTKPIWKRKSFSRLYNFVNLSFEEKQGKITQEIINAERQELNIQFQLTLTYCHDPKSAVITIRLGTGDLEAFREFGKFFISVTQNWITELLKPFSMPNCKDTATKIAETMQVENNENDIDSDDDDDSEIIIVPKSERADDTSSSETLSNKNTDQLPADKTGQKLTKSPPTKSEIGRDDLDKSITESPVITANHLNDTVTEKQEIETSKNAVVTVTETTKLTNHTDGSGETTFTKQVDVTNNAESVTKNAVTLTKNVESFFKNAESILASAASSSDTSAASASDVSVACALK
uniref:Speckle targeted PIP5K1A-regulated poly(A) polymerase n=1 Tax=Heliothis virescens TaxID=7102 RepID=A0A2A4IU34_HELVI